MSYFQLFGSLLIGLAAGFIGAIAGGGGMITVPFLLFLGLPPQVALATSKFGGLGMCSGAIIKFVKEKAINWKVAIILSIGGIVASLIGSKILLSTSPQLLEKIIAILLLLLLPTIFVKKGFGIKKMKVHSWMKVLGVIIYFLLSIMASMFGGLGVLMITTVVYFFGLSMIEANATDIISYAVLSVVAVIIYIIHGIVNFPLGLALFVGLFIGGYAGAHTAIKKGNQWVKLVFAIVIIASELNYFSNECLNIYNSRIDGDGCCLTNRISDGFIIQEDI